MMRTLPLLTLACLLPVLAAAQSTTTTTTTSSTTSSAAQAAAIQQQITTGIENGTLSATQIQELQAQELQLQAASSSASRSSASSTVTPDATDLAAQRFNQEVKATNSATNSGTKANATGPDPFTYNSLGPDAYDSQKYKNPEYNVPAYPTTNPVSNGTSQQFSGPSAGAPYGAGYAQSPLPSGTGEGVYAPSNGGVATPTGQGVYVYSTHSGR